MFAPGPSTKNQEPVTHVTVFMLKPTFRTAHAAQLLAHMREVIPGLVSLDFGAINTKPFADYADRSGGYTHVLVSKHTGPAALKVYHDHPVHINLLKYLRSVVATKPLAFDITCHL